MAFKNNLAKSLLNIKYKIEHVVMIPVSVPNTCTNDVTVTLSIATTMHTFFTLTCLFNEVMLYFHNTSNSILM